MKHSTWKHKLKNKNIESRTADCLYCGENISIVVSCGIWRCKKGRLMGKRGTTHKRLIYRNLFIGNKLNELKSCEKCGLTDIDLRFFDVNHKDGNHDNNYMENLELLCPNCHRKETLNQWNKNGFKKYRTNYMNA